MKKVFLLLGLIFFTFLHSFAQEANNLITTMRIGIFKLKSTVSEIEKACGQKIIIKHKQDNYYDTVKIKYNNCNYILTFLKQYNEDTTANIIWNLYGISSANTTLKTKSGIGLYNTKAKVLSTYDKNDITIANDWDYKTKSNAKDKIQFIMLNDFEAGTTLIFNTEDRIVKSIEVKIYEGE